ncbi:DUF4214 domain-containing protein [Massilia sp. 9I]|uniref:DUF4214 domain-containing protein n=1 Tax=Massilia sp. 9I TaxID=2653152 RepID=UPI0012F1F91C|nr:DUF4214 domain-containing protein [Massilia sp. 9I]VXB88044.1 conserved hypothetical protein [Massilia sp. 9I]
MTDTKAPVLKRFVLPSVIDIGKGPQSFRIEVEGDDGADGSGLSYVSIWLDQQLELLAHDGYMLQFGYVSQPNGFGDDTPNAAFADYTLLGKTPVRTYTVTSVWLTDKAGNVAQYETAQLKALGMNTTLSVTGRPADVTAPVLKGLNLPSIIDVSSGKAILPVSIQASDAGGEGVDMVTVWLDRDLVTDGWRTSALSVGNRLTADDFRDDTPERTSKSIVLDPTTPPGTYNVNRVEIVDRVGNRSVVEASELKAMGVSTSFTVTGGTVDTTPAELIDLWLPRTVSVKPGAQNAFVVSARDPGGKGVSSALALFDRELNFSEGKRDALSVNKYIGGDDFEDLTPGFGVDRFKLTEATVPGTYNITSVILSDQAGNFTTYTPLQLQQRGINTAITVVDRPASASATPYGVDGQLRVALSSTQWASEGTDAFSVTVAYDAATLRLVDALVPGVAGSQVSVSVTQPGRVLVSGSGALPASASLELVLQPLQGNAPFQYAVESFRVNGSSQVMATGNLEYVRFGTAGADVLTDTVANGLIDGRDGLDLAVFDGLRSAYTISKSGSGFVVTRGDGDRVVLSSVERLKFGDGMHALDLDGAGGQVYRLYQAAFDRKPEGAGVGWWMQRMDEGTPLLSVARSFLASGEFERKYGVDPDSESFLTALYTNVLHRAPDPDGYAYWLKSLRANFDRAELLVLFSESAENVAQVLATIQHGFDYV